jgi:hypothetical protein
MGDVALTGGSKMMDERMASEIAMHAAGEALGAITRIAEAASSDVKDRVSITISAMILVESKVKAGLDEMIAQADTYGINGPAMQEARTKIGLMDATQAAVLFTR